MKQTAEEQIKELKQQLADANEKIAQLMAIIKLQRNQIFGKKTEIMESVVNGQQSLFSEQEMDQLQDPDISVTKVTEKKIKQVVRHRKAKQSGQRTTFLDGLPQVNEVISLKDTNCPHCHQLMKRIGQHIYSREARLKPAELYCVNLIQETYKCDECINSNGSEVLISSEMPQSLLPHSYFSSTILAKVAELKFNLALPFHRQIKLWQAIGLQVDARLLAANIIKVSQTYLEPLYDYLQGLVKT